jgi:hypothetical protein
MPKTRKLQTAGRQGPDERPQQLVIDPPINLVAPPGFQANPATGSLVANVQGAPAPPGFRRVGFRYYPEIPGYQFLGTAMAPPYSLLYQRMGGGRRKTKKRSTRRRR